MVFSDEDKILIKKSLYLKDTQPVMLVLGLVLKESLRTIFVSLALKLVLGLAGQVLVNITVHSRG